MRQFKFNTMKKTIAILTLMSMVALSCNSSQKEEVSEEEIQLTQEVENATEALEESADELTNEVKEIESEVDSLLQDI